MIGYGTCVGSWEKLTRNVIPNITGPLFALSGQTRLTVAYNTILDAYKGRGVDAVVLLHDDLEITDPLADPKFLAALADPDVALVGVCGGKGDKTLAWWTSETVGHQMTDSGMVDFGPRSGDVAFIEGSIMVFSRWAVDNLRFDPSYPGFLGYDDVCLTARSMGKRVTVVDVDTHHHSTVGFKSAAIASAWDVAEQIFQAKWHTDPSAGPRSGMGGTILAGTLMESSGDTADGRLPRSVGADGKRRTSLTSAAGSTPARTGAAEAGAA